jgi:hypothetical protein
MSDKPTNWVDLSRLGMSLLKVKANDKDVFVLVGLSDDRPEHIESAKRLGFRPLPKNPSRWFTTVIMGGLDAVVDAFPGAVRTEDATPRVVTVAPRPQVEGPVDGAGQPEPRADVRQATVEQGDDPRPRPQRDRQDGRREVLVDAPPPRRLGRNRMGAIVLENETEGRFFYGSNGRPVFERGYPAGNEGLFLRAASPAALQVAVDGFVEGMASGEIQRINDFLAFASILYGEEVTISDPRVVDVQSAITIAMLSRVAKMSDKGAREAFGEAQKLQESQPYFLELVRSHPDAATPPLPFGVVVSRLLGTEQEIVKSGVSVINSGNGSLLSWIPRGTPLSVHEANATDRARVSAAVSEIGLGSARVLADAPLGSDTPVRIEAFSRDVVETPVGVSGARFHRSDLATAAMALQNRADEGRWVLMFDGPADENEAKEIEQFRAWVAQRYAIEGAVDVAAAIHSGVPGNPDKRILVVGRRRPEVLDTPPEAAMRLRHAPDYATLWTWTSEVIANRAKVADYFANAAERDLADGSDGATVPVENRFQAPYIAASRSGTATSMVPRNLEAATHEALAKAARRHGNDPDLFVANALGYTVDEIHKYLSPEQIDAVLLALDAHERGRAFLAADQMGLGKGRTLAALMRWSAMQGNRVLFLTEKAMNLSDIWRDINHTGSAGEFAPFILNNGAAILDERTNEALVESEPDALIRAICHLRHWPDGSEIIAHTLTEAAVERIKGDKDLLARLGTRFSGKEIFQFGEEGPDGVPEGITTDDFKQSERFAPDSNLVMASVTQFNRAVTDSVKSAWLAAVVDENVHMYVDESHNVASGGSKQAKNVQTAIGKAGWFCAASGTWAKNGPAMVTYKRLFPPHMDTDNLAAIISKGGETMQEVMSAMLVKDGVMVRREHDASRCRYRTIFDEERYDRNRVLTNALAPVLQEMAFLSGDIGQRVGLKNDEIADQIGARVARGEINEVQAERQVRKLQFKRVGFGAPMFNLQRVFLAALSVDAAVEGGIKDLKEGRKPIFVVDSTIESLFKELLEKQEQEDGAQAPDYKDMLRRALRQMTRVTRNRAGRVEHVNLVRTNAADEWFADFMDKLDAALPRDALTAGTTTAADVRRGMLEALGRYDAAAQDRIRTDRSMDATAEEPGLEVALNRVRDRIRVLPDDPAELIATFEGMMKDVPNTGERAVRRIEAMIDRMPPIRISYIDDIRDRVESEGRRLFEAGEIAKPWRIGEITGRTTEIRDGRIVRKRRVDKVEEKNAFNSGELDGLVLNNSGMTGIDLHASVRFKDQRQRMLYEVMPPFDIVKLVQGYGRVARYDQVIAPEVVSIVSGLPSAVRLNAMQNIKLMRLSANVSSNRESQHLRDCPDLINPLGDRVCEKYFELRPELVRRLGLQPVVREEAAKTDDEKAEAKKVEEAVMKIGGDDSTDAKRTANEFLARVMLLPFELQEQIIMELEAEYEAELADLDARGLNPLRSKEVQGTVHVRRKWVLEGAATENVDSVFDEAVWVWECAIERETEGLRRADVERLVDQGDTDFNAVGGETLADRLAYRRNDYLSDFLPPGVRSVEEATEQTAPSVVRRAAAFDRLIENLRKIRPGSEIVFTDDGVQTSGIVADIVIPPRSREHMMSQYKVRLAVPGEPDVSNPISLEVLSSDEKFAIGDGLHGRTSEQILKTFDDRSQTSMLYEGKFLVGNLAAAMDTNIKMGMGRLCSFRDSEGRIHRGIQISKKHRNLEILPVRLMTPAMATAAFLKRDSADIRSTPDQTVNEVYLKKSKSGDLILHLPHIRSKAFAKYFRDDEKKIALEIEELLKRNVTKGQGAPVVILQEYEVEDMLTMLANRGVRFYTTMRHREWAVKWAEKNLAGDVDLTVRAQDVAA